MSSIKKKNLLERFIYIVLMIIIAVYACYFIRSEAGRTYGNYINKVTELKEGWYITGHEDNKVNLPQNIELAQDDIFKISRIIDKDFLKNNSEIFISPYYCDINVYISNERVYSYESYKKGIGRSDGVVRLIVHLPDVSENNIQELTIEYIPQFKLNLYSIKPPVVGEKGSLIMHYYNKGAFHICIAGMFVFIGVVLMCIYTLAIRKITDETEIFNVGLFSVLCGIYLICQIEWSYILMPNQKVLYISEFLSLALMGLPLLFIMYRFDKARLKNIYIIAIIANTVNFIVQVIIYCLGIRELKTMLDYTHIVLFLSSLIAVTTIVKSREDHILKKSVIALVFGGMAETILYHIKVIEVGQCIKIGILVFVILQIIYQFERCRKLYDEIKENQIYQNLAYVDILTGIDNRNSYEKDISFIERDKQSYESIECAVIDLNELKNTNDTYGHVAGDELIRTFGHILRNTLNKEHKSYRIGGDEFVIIFLNASKEKIIRKLKEVEQRTYEYNLNSEINISYSLGIAEYNERKHENVMNMISEADEKMYRDKVESKICNQ